MPTHLGRTRNYARALRANCAFLAPTLSQNLEHTQVLTTLMRYGAVATERQGDTLRGLETTQQSEQSDANEIADAVLKRLRDCGVDLHSQMDPID